MTKRIVRLPQVREKTGLPTSTIYALIEQGLFPGQVKLGPRAAGWIEGEIDAWLDTKISQRDGGAR